MKIKHLPTLEWLFDGTAAGAPASDAGTTGDTTSQVPADAAQGKPGDLSAVKYGKQDAADAAQPKAPADDPAPAETPEARAKRFDDLINGEFKDLYTAKTQELIDRRFAKSKATENEAATLRDIAGILNEKYGISEDADYSKLRAAIENDDEIWASKAEAQGLTVEQFKEFNKLQRRNAAYEAARQNDIKAAMQREKTADWARQAQALKAKYPDFDLRYELENTPGFIQALEAGAPMELLYTGAHFDELQAASANAAAKQAEQKVVSNIRAKGQRPTEAGTASTAAATVKSDPSKLTLKDYEEIERRVRNGETIRF